MSDMGLNDLPMELVRDIAGYFRFEGGHSTLGSLSLTCKRNREAAGAVLWARVTVADTKAKEFFEVLDSSEDYVRWIRTLTVTPYERGSFHKRDEEHVAGYIAGKAPHSELCALFVKVLRKMPGLLSLDLSAVLCGPAVIAELCAHKESYLRSLRMEIGRVDDTEDLSVLPDLELSTGMLQSLELVGCVQEEYPQRFVDAISRIIQASAKKLYSLEIWNAQHVQQFFKGVKGFPGLGSLEIRDVDLIPLPCFISEAKWIETLRIHCKGNMLDLNTANCIGLYFGSMDWFFLVLDTAPWEVHELMKLGSSLIALCAKIKIFTVEVDEYADMHQPALDDGEQDEDQAENDVENEEAVEDNHEVGEHTGEIVVEEVVGHSDDEADEDVGGDGDAGNETDVANEEGEDYIPNNQVEEERSIVHSWSLNGDLELVRFWYTGWDREWSRDDTSGEWTLDEHPQ